MNIPLKIAVDHLAIRIGRPAVAKIIKSSGKALPAVNQTAKAKARKQGT